MNRTYRTNTLPSRYVQIGEKKYLWFSGTDYLDMAYHPELIRLITEGLQKLGTHYGSSRNNNLRIEAFREAEMALAHFTGAEDALMVSSGMIAGALTRLHLPDAIHSIYHNVNLVEWEAPMLHPALRRGQASIDPWSDWAISVSNQIRESSREDFHIIYTDALGTPKTTPFDFSPFCNLDNCLVVVDDSHGLGVTGSHGQGTIETLRSLNIKSFLIVSSLNKAMGIPGGVILGSEKILNELRQTATYAGASPLPPAYAQALTRMIEQNEYGTSHAVLMRNTSYFEEKLGDTKKFFFHIPAYPVYTTTDSGLFDFLESKLILTSSFQYPSKNDPLLTRIVITSAHHPEDLEYLAKCCIEYYAS